MKSVEAVVYVYLADSSGGVRNPLIHTGRLEWHEEALGRRCRRDWSCGTRQRQRRRSLQMMHIIVERIGLRLGRVTLVGVRDVSEKSVLERCSVDELRLERLFHLLMSPPDGSSASTSMAQRA